MSDHDASSHREELATMHALGALDGGDLAQVAHCLGCPASEMSRAVEEFDVLVATMSLEMLPQLPPPANAKAEIDRMLGFSEDAESPQPDAEHGFAYVMNDEGEWKPLPVLKGGARVKELSKDDGSGFTVLLLELDAGTRFPSHNHHGLEETFLISGDLHIEDRVLGPGDYARALPGTRHSALYSENGCRALIVTAPENYPESAVRAYGALHKAVGKLKGFFKPESGE